VWGGVRRLGVSSALLQTLRICDWITKSLQTWWLQRKLLAPSIPLTMVSRRDLLSAQRSWRASKQREQGTLRSLVCSAAVRSDPSQESGLEVLRKNDHGEAHALKAFHGFKSAVRIESMNRVTRLSHQKRYVHLHSGMTSLLSHSIIIHQISYRLDRGVYIREPPDSGQYQGEHQRAGCQKWQACSIGDIGPQ
jgi:hypothetical protein